MQQTSLNVKCLNPECQKVTCVKNVEVTLTPLKIFVTCIGKQDGDGCETLFALEYVFAAKALKKYSLIEVN